ncbi:putative ribonuclease H-like domain-containing protein [Tanacetum coccineum]
MSLSSALIAKRLPSDIVVVVAGNPQMDLQDQGVIDSGCSRHMTGNMSYLTDFEEIDGGYVAFGGNPKGGKITGRGTIKTGNLDFENVYFVKELKFNLFSVSQMCDKKNSVLFNDTECIVLSPNFKLTDESHVLLKVPRKNNMYSVDLKNIVPKGGLTCLFAKATSNESKLWHRRLRHINFKTMNKLVKGNLVRGLPSKLFENNQTCVACQKGKQHRASCKSKTGGIRTKPITRPHYELFVVGEPALGFMSTFGCPVTIINTIDHLGKFDGKANKRFFVRYSINSKEFRVFNSGTRIVEENLHVQFSDNIPKIFAGKWTIIGFLILSTIKSMNYKLLLQENRSNGKCSSKSSLDAGFKPSSDGEKKVDGDPSKEDKRLIKRRMLISTINAAGIEVNVVGAKTSIELLDDPNIPELEDIIYSDDDEDVGAEADMNNLDAFMRVSPILTTRIYKDHPLKQIIGDLNSASQIRRMTKNLEEHGFEDPDFPDRVNMIGNKALYGLHQASKAWLKPCSIFLLDQMGFREEVSKDLFIKKDKDEFYGKHTFFLGLQVKQKEDGTFISQDKYLKGQPKLGLWYPKDSPFDLVAYTDSDYARASLDRKSTTGGFQFLRCRLISWQCKKQTVVVNSTTEAEYVSALSCCGQVKAVNGEVQLQALVDGKKIIITELIVRRDLRLDDAEGVECLPNATIFEELTRMGLIKLSNKLYAWNEFSSTMASAIICLATNQKFNFSKYIFESMLKNLDNAGKSCDIKVGRSARMVSSDESSLGDQEDASKQERKIDDIDADAEIKLVDKTQGRHDDDLMFDTGVLNDEEVFTGQDMDEKEVSTTDPVTTVSEVVTTVNVVIKKKDQISFDEQEAIRLQPEFDEEVRLVREKDEANVALIEE